MLQLTFLLRFLLLWFAWFFVHKLRTVYSQNAWTCELNRTAVREWMAEEIRTELESRDFTCNCGNGSTGVVEYSVDVTSEIPSNIMNCCAEGTSCNITQSTTSSDTTTESTETLTNTSRDDETNATRTFTSVLDTRTTTTSTTTTTTTRSSIIEEPQTCPATQCNDTSPASYSTTTQEMWTSTTSEISDNVTGADATAMSGATDIDGGTSSDEATGAEGATSMEGATDVTSVTEMTDATAVEGATNAGTETGTGITGMEDTETGASTGAESATSVEGETEVTTVSTYPVVTSTDMVYTTGINPTDITSPLTDDYSTDATSDASMTDSTTSMEDTTNMESMSQAETTAGTLEATTAMEDVTTTVSETTMEAETTMAEATTVGETTVAETTMAESTAEMIATTMAETTAELIATTFAETTAEMQETTMAETTVEQTTTPTTTTTIASTSIRSCQQHYDDGETTSGVKSILLDTGDPINVYCDQDTDGGGWTVFQRRLDGSVDFYRNWEAYMNGFGDLNAEHWLGLDVLHSLTSSSITYALRVDLEDFSGNAGHAHYSEFVVGPMFAKYNLATLGAYSGTVGDSLTYSSGSEFSTYDNDNDEADSDSCAEIYSGAWWYKNCHYSNLNGIYNATEGKGVVWNTWLSGQSLKETSMKIRPI